MPRSYDNSGIRRPGTSGLAAGTVTHVEFFHGGELDILVAGTSVSRGAHP
jgi:hypothetical protein